MRLEGNSGEWDLFRSLNMHALRKYGGTPTAVAVIAGLAIVAAAVAGGVAERADSQETFAKPPAPVAVTAKLVKGKVEAGKPTLVRMHQVDFAADLLGHVESRQDYVPRAMKVISREPGPGVVVFLRDPGLQGLAERLAGADKPAAVDRSLRAYGVGAQILLDLGVRDMIVMSSTRPAPTALEGYGLRIVGWRDMDGEEPS